MLSGAAESPLHNGSCVPAACVCVLRVAARLRLVFLLKRGTPRRESEVSGSPAPVPSSDQLSLTEKAPVYGACRFPWREHDRHVERGRVSSHGIARHGTLATQTRPRGRRAGSSSAAIGRCRVSFAYLRPWLFKSVISL